MCVKIVFGLYVCLLFGIVFCSFGCGLRCC